MKRYRDPEEEFWRRVAERLAHSIPEDKWVGEEEFWSAARRLFDPKKDDDAGAGKGRTVTAGSATASEQLDRLGYGSQYGGETLLFGELKPMPAVLPVSEAKRHFTQLHQQASEELQTFIVGDGPGKDAKLSVTLGAEALEALLEDVKFTHQWIQDTENDGWTVVIPELDVYGEGETQEQAALDAVEAAEEYARLYGEDSRLYFRAGRRHHYRYVLRLLLALARQEDLRVVLGL